MSDLEFARPVQLMGLIVIIQSEKLGFGTTDETQDIWCALGQVALDGATSERLMQVFENFESHAVANEVHSKVHSALLAFCSEPTRRLIAASTSLAEARALAAPEATDVGPEETYRELVASALRVEEYLLATMDDPAVA